MRLYRLLRCAAKPSPKNSNPSNSTPAAAPPPPPPPPEDDGEALRLETIRRANQAQRFWIGFGLVFILMHFGWWEMQKRYVRPESRTELVHFARIKSWITGEEFKDPFGRPDPLKKKRGGE